jgi:hypothetical protein
MVAQNVQAALEDEIRKHLGSDVISVKATRDDDDDEDDDVLWVTVVVEQSASGEGDMSSLVRHLRPRLSELGETAFPVISFMSKQERDQEMAA